MGGESVNALLNYPGAKWGMAQEIVQIMPPNRSYIDRIRRTTMKIYISGKIAGDPDYKGKFARAAAEKLLEAFGEKVKRNG